MTGLNPHPTPGPAPESPFDAWNFRSDTAVELQGAKLAGYKVEAVDGSVGKVTDCNLDPGDSYLVISTGRILGRTVLVPAGTANHIDHTERTIYLDRTRDQVKQAPEVPAEAYADSARRDEVAGYYERTYHARG